MQALFFTPRHLNTYYTVLEKFNLLSLSILWDAFARSLLLHLGFLRVFTCNSVHFVRYVSPFVARLDTRHSEEFFISFSLYLKVGRYLKLYVEQKTLGKFIANIKVSFDYLESLGETYTYTTLYTLSPYTHVTIGGEAYCYYLPVDLYIRYSRNVLPFP